MNIELTDDEFETLKDIFFDWGSDCPDTDCDARRALGEKLGFLEREKHTVLTREEMERRNKFAEAMRPILEASNHLLENIKFAPLNILYGQAKIGSTLRVKIPTDYAVINV